MYFKVGYCQFIIKEFVYGVAVLVQNGICIVCIIVLDKLVVIGIVGEKFVCVLFVLADVYCLYCQFKLIKIFVFMIVCCGLEVIKFFKEVVYIKLELVAIEWAYQFFLSVVVNQCYISILQVEFFRVVQFFLFLFQLLFYECIISFVEIDVLIQVGIVMGERSGVFCLQGGGEWVGGEYCGFIFKDLVYKEGICQNGNGQVIINWQVINVFIFKGEILEWYVGDGSVLVELIFLVDVGQGFVEVCNFFVQCQVGEQLIIVQNVIEQQIYVFCQFGLCIKSIVCFYIYVGIIVYIIKLKFRFVGYCG